MFIGCIYTRLSCCKKLKEKKITCKETKDDLTQIQTGDSHTWVG
jgi:hypothetical protein